MSVPTQADALQTALNNYAQLLVYVTQAVGNPIQANIDTAIRETDRHGLLRTMPTRLDGTGYDWQRFQDSIISQMATLRMQLQHAGGPVFAAIRYGGC